MDERSRARSMIIGVVFSVAAWGTSAAGTDERIEKLSTEHRAWLESEVVYIIADREKDVFLDLQTIEERERFIEAFWARRDPDRATPRNEFKDEHYERLEFANQTFSRQTSRAGWQTDQGRIYITLGPPRERDRFEAHFNVVYCELWTYQAPYGSTMPPFFHLLFFKQHDVGEYELYSPVMDGPLRLVRGIDRYTNDPQLALRELLDISPNLAHASLTFDLGESPDYANGKPSLNSELIVARIADVPLRTVRTDYVDAWVRYGGKVGAEYSFNFVPSRSVFSVLAGPESTPFVHFRIEIDPENLRLVHDEDQAKFYTTLDVSVEVTSGDGTRVLAHDKEIFIELTPSEIQRVDQAPFAYQDDFPLVPGDYNVSVILRNRTATQYTIAESELALSSFSTEEAGLSDLVLAYQSEITTDDAAETELRTFQIGQDRVHPAADGLFFIGETAHAFFQVLGPVDSGHRVSFELIGDDGVVAERAAPVERYLPGPAQEDFPLLDVESGTYQLRVQLVAPSGETVAEKRAALNVSARNALPRAWVHSRCFDARVPGALALARGSQLQALERHEEAARELGRAVLADPERAEPRWRLAGIHLGWREPDAALALLLPLEEEHGERYEVLAGLGFAFYMSDDAASALPFLEKASAMRPPGTGLLNALADCHETLGNTDESRTLLERSLELDPSQTKVREKLASLGGEV